MLERLELENFTAFDKLDMRFCQGINILIGENGTGKTHILKILYAAMAAYKREPTDECVAISDKINAVFMPDDENLGRLVKRKKGSTSARVGITKTGKLLTLSLTNHTRRKLDCDVGWVIPVEDSSVYIPVKEMLANAPGFRSLYNERMIRFEEVYADIIDKAFISQKRGRYTGGRRKLLDMIQKTIDGKVISKGEQFYLKNKHGELEFSLLAEGMRKLGLIWLLIQNGTLLKGAKLFWDEPETNLNPSLFGPLIEILLELQRKGVQVFLATHDYVILKELDLRKQKKNMISFHSLHRDKDSGEIKSHTTDEYLQIHPNAIQDTFLDLFDRDIRRDLGLPANG